MIGRLARRAAKASYRLIRPVLLASAAAVAVAGFIAPTSANAATLSPPGCTGNYVVGSTPLVDLSNGVADWGNGYVQLWYSNSCEENWTRVVSQLPDTTYVYAEVDRQDGASTCAETSSNYSCQELNFSTTVESPPIWSPCLKDAAYGQVEADGTYYAGFWAQSGFYDPYNC